MVILSMTVPDLLKPTCRDFLKFSRFYRNTTYKNSSKRQNIVLKALLGVITGAATTVGILLNRSVVKATAAELEPPSYPWEFKRHVKSLDHAAIRRGWQVYKTVCYTCHSVRFVRFADMIDVAYTMDEVKAIAAEFEVEDGPNEEGEYYLRPGKISDRVPPPFPNEEAARAANNNANPPDLTCIIPSKIYTHDYMFSLLTGYMDPPAGIELTDTQYFNAYFIGGTIGMAPALFDGAVEYDDGTPATVSQMAKDIVEFLTWTYMQEHDARKLMGIQATGVLLALIALVFHIKKHIWSIIHSRQIFHVPKMKSKFSVK